MAWLFGLILIYSGLGGASAEYLYYDSGIIDTAAWHDAIAGAMLPQMGCLQLHCNV